MLLCFFLQAGFVVLANQNLCNITVLLQYITVWMCRGLQLVEASKQAGEKQLLEKKEKLMLELQKIKDRVDEFNDYGELDMMQQYVQVKYYYLYITK